MHWSQLSIFCKDRACFYHKLDANYFKVCTSAVSSPIAGVWKINIYLHILIFDEKHLSTWCIQICQLHSARNWSLVQRHGINWWRTTQPSKLKKLFSHPTHKWQKQSQSHKWKESQSLFQDALTYRLWRVHVRVVFCIVATVCSQHYFKYLVCFDYSIFYKQTYKNKGIVSVQKSVKCVNILIALGEVMCLTQISNSLTLIILPMAGVGLYHL